MKSFRAQIRSSTLALIIAVLVVFSVLVYWGLTTLLQRFVDGRLLGLAETLTNVIEQKPELLSTLKEEIVLQKSERLGDERNEDLGEVSHSIQVLALDGTVLWKAEDVLRGPPLSAAVLNRGMTGEIVYESVYTTAGKKLRRIVMPIHEEGKIRYLLQAEASLVLKQLILRDLIVLLVLSSIAMIIVSWFGSDWLARKTVKAIDALSRTAEAVSESSFNDRVNMDVPFDEFQRLARAFNAMLDRLQKGYDLQRHFVDYAAHEMQTPLTVLQGNLEVALQRVRTAEDYREVLVSNLKQVERLIRLTKSLLTLARFASDRPPVHLAPVKLEPLLRELIEDLTLIAADRNIRLSLDSEAVPVVLGDELRLKELVINLLDNALRYTESGGAITVRLRTSGDVVTVAVQDTGQGIGSEHLPHLFERFYRANTGRARNSDGTGLGLPIVKEIAAAHNGMITVESEVDKGSIFTLTLHAMKLLNIGVMK